MSRRIDIELTSSREDGSWTWRAAGAKQPRGTVAAALLPAGAAVGDVLRAEVDAGLDGTEVLAVTPPKAKRESSGERIELLGRDLSEDQLVTTTLAGRGGRGRGDRGDRGERGERRGRGPRREGEDRGPRGERAGRGEREGRGARPGGERGPRRDGERTRPGGDRANRPRRERPAPPPRPKAKRLRAGRTHRKAALEALLPEEQVVAEHVLRGGIPAVRQAVARQNEQARAEGHPLVKADPVVAVAERLLPALRAADWRDKAEAAVADLDELDLRDLRSVVVAAEGAARDEETRALAEQLREGLARRVDQEQQAWLAEIAATLDDGRVVRALRLSSRPPKAGAPLPADLGTRLTEAASAALTADTVADRWAAVLDALATSPVRLTVEPASRPENPSPELVGVITRAAGRVPKVAAAFGIDAPAESARRRSGRPGGPGGGGGRRPKPPPRPEVTTPPAGEAAAPPPGEPAGVQAPDEADEAATSEPSPEASSVPTAQPEPVSEVVPEPAGDAVPERADVTAGEAATEAPDPSA